VTDLPSLTVEQFAARVGERFVLADGTAYELVEATPLPVGAGAPRPPFSLVFAGPPGTVRPQGIETLENEQLGPLEIFLVPIGQDAEAVRYEAVFA
jgi:hypothetical protein